MANTFIPEETIFASLLTHGEFPFGSELAQGSIRWRHVSPASIGDGTLAELQRSDALFARKVVTERSAELLAWVEATAG